MDREGGDARSGSSFSAFAEGQGASAPSGYASSGTSAAVGGSNVQYGAGANGLDADTALLAEKDATIGELNDTISILELKVKKLEQLVRLKDSRIQTLTQKLEEVMRSR